MENMEDSNYTKSTGHHMILRWVNNKLFTTKKLFMVDVDPEDTFYPRKSYICQFPRASECHIHSVEGEIKLKNLKILLHIIFSRTGFWDVCVI